MSNKIRALGNSSTSLTLETIFDSSALERSVEIFSLLKFTFSEKATKIFTVNLTVCSNHQIKSEDFVNFCGLLRKYELLKVVDS